MTMARGARPARPSGELSRIAMRVASRVSLRAAIMLGGAILLIGLWAVFAVQLQLSRTQLLNDARRQAENLSLAFREHIASRLGRFDDILLAVRAEYDRNPDVDLRQMARLHFDAVGEANEIDLVDDQGNIFQTTAAVPYRLPEAALYRWPEKHPEQAMYLSRNFTDPVSGATVLYMSRPLNRSDGRHVGFLVLSFNIDVLSDFFQKIDVGNKGAITMVGTDGVIRFRATRGGISTGGEVRNGSVFERVMRGASKGIVEGESALDHVSRIYSYRTLPGYGLYVNVGLDTDEVLALYRQTRSLYLAVGLLITVVFAAVVWLTAAQASRVEKLAKSLSRRGRDLMASREELKLAALAKSQAFAAISYQMRSPLSAVVGFNALIADALSSERIDRELVRECTAHIGKGGQQLLGTVSDIFEMSQLDSGQLELIEGPADLTQILEISTAVANAREKRTDIAVVSDLGAELPLLFADGARLKQIFSNILSNALKSAPSGSSVRISVTVAADGAVAVRIASTSEAGARAGGARNALLDVDAGLAMPIAGALTRLHDGELTVARDGDGHVVVCVTFPASRQLAPLAAGQAVPLTPEAPRPVATAVAEGVC